MPFHQEPQVKKMPVIIRIASEIYYWPKRRHLSLLCPVEGQQRGSKGQAMQPTL